MFCIDAPDADFCLSPTPSLSSLNRLQNATLKAKVDSLQRSLTEKDSSAFGMDKTLADSIAKQRQAEAVKERQEKELAWMRKDLQDKAKEVRDLSEDRDRHATALKETREVSLLVGIDTPTEGAPVWRACLPTT